MRVVQLLIIGLVGLLFGWLGNFFVGTSCHFASVQVPVGQYNDMFDLHFGLWKYSPADSVVSGYTYCYPYSYQAPTAARIFHILAFLAGTYSLLVLWWYLIAGQAIHAYWRWAVRAALVAGACQLCTLMAFYVSGLCRSRTCSLGPASGLAIVTALAWMVLAAELSYNIPNAAEDAQITNIEMADLHVASQEYMERVVGYRPPSLD